MNLVFIVPLVLGCIAILAAIPVRAYRGKLHVPGYAGIAIIAFGASFVCGLLSGYRSFAGSPLGIILAVLCFLLAATSTGSILAVFFYRDRAEV